MVRGAASTSSSMQRCVSTPGALARSSFGGRNVSYSSGSRSNSSRQRVVVQAVSDGLIDLLCNVLLNRQRLNAIASGNSPCCGRRCGRRLDRLPIWRRGCSASASCIWRVVHFLILIVSAPTFGSASDERLWVGSVAQGMPIDSSVAELLTAQLFVLVQEAPDPIYFYINSTGIAVSGGRGQQGGSRRGMPDSTFSMKGCEASRCSHAGLSDTALCMGAWGVDPFSASTAGANKCLLSICLLPDAEKHDEVWKRARGHRGVQHDDGRSEVLPHLHAVRGQCVWRGGAAPISRVSGEERSHVVPIALGITGYGRHDLWSRPAW